VNRLGEETSPYLRQHRDNPVDWYPWGDAAFAAATERNVPILLSVGYSACHWCHVMAHECFEDDEVAATMNELFVCVKVDREERPDVDAIYMDAVQAMSGRGGWPMTVFMTPDGKPFFGGTYYPKDAFLQLMAAIDDAYRNRPDDIRQNTNALLTTLRRSSEFEPADGMPDLDALNTALQTLGRAFDREWGGFGTAPKFPPTSNLELLVRAYVSSGSEAARQIVTTSLDAMASGGMYDHLGGGFSRYSVDREWLVPHFEKMLYDQALLLPVYLHGLTLFRQPQWQQVIEETIGYVLTTLRHPAGGFASAEDADSLDEHGNGVEGRFYTWTPAEVRAALADVDPATVDRFLAWFDITDGGNFEGRSIPNRMSARGELRRPADIEDLRRRLFVDRAARPRPGLDDKVLTEWNALFLSALAQVAAAFGRADWLEAAVANGEFLLRELRAPDGRWHRSWQSDATPPARHDALAADHAALVDAFTRLAEATGQARWIDEARAVTETMLDHFWDPERGGLFTIADDAEPLVARQKDIVDSATPSANSLAAVALYRLAALTGEQRYANHADRIVRLIAGQLDERTSTMYVNVLLAAELRRRGFTEVVIVGDRPDLVRFAHRVWRPDTVLAWGEPYPSPLWDGRAPGYAYVCRDYACGLPQDTVEGLAKQLSGPDGTTRSNPGASPPRG
jgi:uncharacterized protein YyaL (SSP411 family)